MIRALFLLHRYLGILFGILVTLWCLSAFVMMYVRYPALSESEALGGLDALDFSACCAPVADVLTTAGRLRSFRIDAVAGRPMLRLVSEGGQATTIDLRSGAAIAAIDSATARRQASAYLANSGSARLPDNGGSSEPIDRDQWTVAGGFDGHRPLYRFRADDPAGREVYVSSVTGEIVQQTTKRERFWNRFGAVIHWLYPVALRQHPKAWQQTVIWTSIAGLFLVGTGVYIGWRQYRSRRNGGRSPYRGAALWHHYCGLIFGVVALAWLASGLLSVNPWGLLEGGGAALDHRRLAGADIDPDELSRLLSRLGRSGQSLDLVRIESAPFAGELALLAYRAGGGVTRIDPATFAPRPVSSIDLRRAADLLSSTNGPLASAEMLLREDSYYFAHHETVSLPVYRIVLADAERTRYYIDPVSGRLLAKIDRNRRWSRWLFEALHRGDFAGWVRQRPVWDLLLISLLLGVTVSAVTGTTLGLRRLLCDTRSAAGRSK